MRIRLLFSLVPVLKLTPKRDPPCGQYRLNKDEASGKGFAKPIHLMTRRAYTDQLFLIFLVSMLSYLSGIAPCGGQADLSAHFAKNETHPKWTFLGSDRKRCYYEISKGTTRSSLVICSRPTG